jgi:hypothetical protein
VILWQGEEEGVMRKVNKSGLQLFLASFFEGLFQFTIKSEAIIHSQEVTDCFRAEAQWRRERLKNLNAFAPQREIKQHV